MWSGKVLITALSLGVVNACSPVTVQEQEQTLRPLTTEEAKSAFQARQKVALGYTAYFSFDSSKIDAKASSVISSAVTAAREDEPVEILLAGHTDRAGSTEYNMALSQRRVDAVAAAFLDAGISPSIIKKTIHGEGQPRTSTLDDQPEASDRRVDIEFVKLVEQLKEPERLTEPEARQARCSPVEIFLAGARLTPCVSPVGQIEAQ